MNPFGLLETQERKRRRWRDYNKKYTCRVKLYLSFIKNEIMANDLIQLL